VKEPAFQDKLAKLGLSVDFKPDDEFVSFIAGDTKKWRELIPAMGIPQVD
jgi:tripartite-type tricarboxylate transporter receptor subunit TctC